MPAVNIRLRWPDGQETTAYSPSTSIQEYFEAGHSYALDDFLERAERGLNAASERVKLVKGFYCSSALDTLGGLRMQARPYVHQDARVQVLEMTTQGSGQVNYASFGDL
jgi:uncharacterized repeat protein (TIGR04042 family)